MRARIVLYSAIAALLVGGIAFAADAMVTTDEERLEPLAEALAVPSSRVTGVLAWSDPGRVPLRVRDDDREWRFEDDDADVGAALTEAFAPLEGPTEVVQRSVDVRSERATVALRLRVRGELHDVSAIARRNGQGWLVADVHVR